MAVRKLSDVGEEPLLTGRTGAAAGRSLSAMNVRQLRALVEVARCGSFTAAAARLFIAQPTLSELVAQLEDSIGMRLLERTTRKVSATLEGRMVVAIAEKLLTAFDEAARDIGSIANGQQGRLSLAVLPSIATRFIPRAIAEFKAAHPNVGIALRDGNALGVQRSVEEGEVELGITSLWSHSPAVEHETLVTDAFGLVCSVNHRLGRSFAPVPWSELADEDMIGLGQATGIGRILAPVLRDMPWLRPPKYEIENITTALYMLERDIGISILPALALPPVLIDSLVFRPLLAPKVEREIKVIWRREHKPSPLALALLDLIKSEL